MKRNLKLLIEYDGTDFFGWQRQSNGRTVQEEIEKCLKQITQEDASIVGAGRTDSGVHARGQVASFFSSTSLSLPEFQRSLNGVLPDDIVIASVEEVDESFSARYSAKEREYHYHISRKPVALDRKYCWLVQYPLNVENMNGVAKSFVGEHDFQAFCKSDSVVDHHRCQVIESYWSVENSKLIYRVRANRFLQGMVRALVGTMVDVGRGYTQKNDIEAILASKNRSKSGQSAPARGLFLERVTY